MKTFYDIHTHAFDLSHPNPCSPSFPLDILRNTPGLSVDKNGNVTVMGHSVQIWIDGYTTSVLTSSLSFRHFYNSSHAFFSCTHT